MSDIVLDLPPPVSVNRTRKVDWKGHRLVKDWCEQADRFLMFAKSRKEVRFDRIPRFEILIVLSEDHVNIDGDNTTKVLIDYLRYRDIIKNDNKACMRRLVVEWGHAPAGCRVTIRSVA